MANINKKLCQAGLLAGYLIIGTAIATGIGIGVSSLKLPLWASTLIGMAICYGLLVLLVWVLKAYFICEGKYLVLFPDEKKAKQR